MGFKFFRGYVKDKEISFDGIYFPLVRRAFARLLSDDLVSVQPMNRPTGLLFCMDYRIPNMNTPKKKFKFLK